MQPIHQFQTSSCRHTEGGMKRQVTISKNFLRSMVVTAGTCTGSNWIVHLMAPAETNPEKEGACRLPLSSIHEKKAWKKYWEYSVTSPFPITYPTVLSGLNKEDLLGIRRRHLKVIKTLSQYVTTPAEC